MKKIVSTLFFALIQLAVFAQLTLNLNIGFELDPDVLNWSAQPNTVQVTVTNSSNRTIQFKFVAKLSRNGQVVMDNNPMKMPIESIGPFEIKLAYVEDVFPIGAVTLYGDIQKTYAKTNAIPGGQYLICAKIIDLKGKDLTPDNCRPFQMTSYQQPALIFPLAATPVTPLARPMFSWTPVVPMPLFGVVYRLRVVEVPENPTTRDNTAVTGFACTYEAATGIELFYREDRKITGVWQRKGTPLPNPPNTGTVNTATNRASSNGGQLSTEAMRAFNYGFPMIDVELNGLTQLLWPADVQEPTAGRSYVWSVQALRADNGKPIGDNNGLSQPAQFFVSEYELPPGQYIVKAPDFVVSDENGCLYGCTTQGGVWEPIDCPEKTRSVSSLPKTLILQSNSKAKTGDKAWTLVDNRAAVLPEPEPMLPLSNFALRGVVNPATNRIQNGGCFWYCKVDENPNGMFPVIRCFWLCNLEPDNNKLGPDPFIAVPDVENGAIALRMANEKSICLNPDGTCRPCNGKLPSKGDIEKARNATNPTTRTAGEPIPGADVKCGKNPPGGSNGIISTGTTDANGNVELGNMIPEVGRIYYVLYTPKSVSGGTTTTKSSAKPVEIPLKDFEKAWVVEGNRAGSQPIMVTQKVGEDVLTITYIKNGVRVNVSKAKK